MVPLDDSNLAVRAARLLARTHGPHDSLGASLSIKKSIPVAGGLAGGSANGAAALLACAALWDLDVLAEELRALAAELGSDVPFALAGRHGGRQRSGRGSRAGAGPGHLPLGAGLRPPRPVDGRRSIGASTSSAPTRRRPRCRPI